METQQSINFVLQIMCFRRTPVRRGANVKKRSRPPQDVPRRCYQRWQSFAARRDCEVGEGLASAAWLCLAEPLGHTQEELFNREAGAMGVRVAAFQGEVGFEQPLIELAGSFSAELL